MAEERGMDPLNFCRTAAEELNIKHLAFYPGVAGFRGGERLTIEVVYDKDKDTLDVHLGGKPQGKHELAMELMRLVISGLRERKSTGRGDG